MTDIPEALVEKAARAMFGHQRVPTYNGTAGQRCGGCDHLLNETDGPNSPRHVRHQAALAIAAVSPNIRAQALRDAADEYEAAMRRARPGAAPHPSIWLRARAEVTP